MLRYFQLFLVLLFGIFSHPELKASHFSNGMLWYEHVGVSKHDYKYVFKAIVIESGGISITQNELSMYVQHQSAPIVDTITLDYQMPPAGKQHPSLSRSWIIEDPEFCGRTNGLFDRGYQLFVSDTITLDSNRVYNFSIEFVCCRDVATNGSTSPNLLLVCHLKTFTEPFSLIPPDFSLFSAVIPEDTLSTIGFIEKDPDSTVSSLSSIYSGTDAINASIYNYSPGFNAQNPFGVNSPVSVNSTANPILSVRAQNVGDYNVGLKQTHVSPTKIIQTFTIDGWYIADFNVRVTNSIDSTNYQALVLDSLSSSVNQICGKKKLVLYSPAGFNRQSVDSTGQQFAFYKPDGSTNPVLKARLLDSSRIELEFLEAIDTNGLYKIEPRLNFSGKYIQGRCGYNLPMQDIFVRVSGCSGISLGEYHQGLKIYPNPVSGILNLSGYSQGSSISIYNLQGQKVWEQTAQNKIKLDLKAGIYTLILHNSSGESLGQEKLLVQ